MISFLLAAAAAAQTALPTDPDLRCMAAYLVAAGNADHDPSTTADDKAGMQSIVMYFFGKIDGRHPGADIRGEIGRLVSSPEYAKVLRPDIERCSVEAQARGNYLSSFGEETEAAGTKR